MMRPTKSGIVRVDKGGSGHFGAIRSKAGKKYTHEGVDYSVHEGEEIYAPCTGVLVKHRYPYADLSYDGLQFDASAGQFVIFYCKPIEALVGQVCREGTVIAHAQAISKRYPGSGVTDHIHFEVQKIDPERLFINSRREA
jgi:murein DD-endopeptidase MepM/ murein hydrolase activator NlpD